MNKGGGGGLTYRKVYVLETRGRAVATLCSRVCSDRRMMHKPGSRVLSNHIEYSHLFQEFRSRACVCVFFFGVVPAVYVPILSNCFFFSLQPSILFTLFTGVIGL